MISFRQACPNIDGRCSCGSSGVSCPEPGNQFCLGGWRSQKNSRRLDKAVATQNKGAVEFRQCNQGIVNVRVCQHSVSLAVVLKRIGNELLASLKDIERVAKHKE